MIRKQSKKILSLIISFFVILNIIPFGLFTKFVVLVVVPSIFVISLAYIVYTKTIWSCYPFVKSTVYLPVVSSKL